jgi:proteasome activator subunit 3 (PA28 gamma)
MENRSNGPAGSAKKAVVLGKYNTELANYRDSVIADAENLIFNEFPAKVLQFEALLNSPDFSHSRMKEVLPDIDSIIPMPKLQPPSQAEVEPPAKKIRFSDNSTPVYIFQGGVVKSNEKLTEMTNFGRFLLRDTVESINKLKLWITFLIPKIEDGNNFGVSIQEEALNEIRTVESEASGFYDQMSRYFLSRAELIVKAAKYPHVEDYRRAVVDIDEKQFINVRLVMMETRNHLATLYDLITKNAEKIKKPRNSNTDHMY